MAINTLACLRICLGYRVAEYQYEAISATLQYFDRAMEL